MFTTIIYVRVDVSRHLVLWYVTGDPGIIDNTTSTTNQIETLTLSASLQTIRCRDVKYGTYHASQLITATRA